jgi:hypothetical protein
MQRNLEKAKFYFIFIEVSRCRYLDRRSIEPSQLQLQPIYKQYLSHVRCLRSIGAGTSRSQKTNKTLLLLHAPAATGAALECWLQLKQFFKPYV